MVVVFLEGFIQVFFGFEFDESLAGGPAFPQIHEVNALMAAGDPAHGEKARNFIR